MGLKKTIEKILVNMAFSILFNYVDKNKDGKISKKELSLVGKRLNKLVSSIKKRK